uniref:Uncharacterized protein n=1 Tax=Anguilla anguilla TaxID=7936 RepID=A0A0E9TK47_ANGAN
MGDPPRCKTLCLYLSLCKTVISL